MSQVPIWFEREFEFSFPVELLPNLRARLRGTPTRLEDTLRGCSNEILTGKPREKWSAQEHAGHLLDLEPLWLARLGDYVAASDQLTMVFLLLVVACFSRRILGRFPALQKCAGSASLFGSHPFISLSSSGVI